MHDCHTFLSSVLPLTIMARNETTAANYLQNFAKLSKIDRLTIFRDSRVLEAFFAIDDAQDAVVPTGLNQPRVIGLEGLTTAMNFLSVEASFLQAWDRLSLRRALHNAAFSLLQKVLAANTVDSESSEYSGGVTTLSEESSEDENEGSTKQARLS